jgi:CheY-like chemotaxis protein
VPAAPVLEAAPANGDARTNGDAQTTLLRIAPLPEAPLLVNEVGDDRDSLHAGDRVLLIVENDLGFARFLLDSAREKGFKGLVTSLGAAALAMAREYNPDAVTLDIFLPDIDGWRVLDRLKNDVVTRHIPVCVISTDEARQRALSSGALAFVAKPIKTKDTVDQLLNHLRDFVGREFKSLLVVEHDPAARDKIVECLDDSDIRITSVPDGRGALQMLRERRIDCMVVGSQLPDLTVAAFADEALDENAVAHPAVIIYGDGKSLQDEPGWKKVAQNAPVRWVHSEERLLDQVSFFLHQDVAKLPEAKRRLVQGMYAYDKVLPGRKVLIVDDDMRNIFALSSILEEHEMNIRSADNGRDAIKILKEQPDIEVVLMDIMMPEMDGMETMREIRKIGRFRELPIIAVTAKAMKGDREKCIEAGAWDYLSKPVDPEQLLAVLRAWLYR